MTYFSLRARKQQRLRGQIQGHQLRGHRCLEWMRTRHVETGQGDWILYSPCWGMSHFYKKKGSTREMLECLQIHLM